MDYIHVFSESSGRITESEPLKASLGGKGMGLAVMSGLGLPVPPGFTIKTDVCRRYYQQEKQIPEILEEQVAAALKNVETETGMKFGDTENPLLVSVRSGAKFSMPGMMDTVLNLGLNDKTVQGLAKKTNNERFALDSYRRFIQMFANVVLGVEHHKFEDVLQWHKDDKGYNLDTELTVADLKHIINQYKKLLEEENIPFPQDAQEQLWKAILAVLDSWGNQRARTYRMLNSILHDIGTAVTVQSMVFGNRGETSATGVVFTRNPSTGENLLYGEFLPNAQGEDVVAGIRTPHTLTGIESERMGNAAPSLEEYMPEVFQELRQTCENLEQYFKDMQDVEFTVQEGKLWILQARAGKRTTAASVKIATDMVHEGLIDKQAAVCRIDASGLDQLLHPMLDPTAKTVLISRGLPASPGAASGEIVFTANEAESKAKKGIAVILVRDETSPEDIHGMHAAKGILTSRGGMTSHAAVVARGMGRPCIAGAGKINIDYKSQSFSVGGRTYKAGEKITINGSSGEVFEDAVPTIEAKTSPEFQQIMEWADSFRKLKVFANAETAQDAKVARRFGAEGIGLCRTEHMFFEESRILAVRQMIVANDNASRQEAINRLMPMQQEDFIKLFDIMRGLPVMIRLLDPPLHEFLPHTEKERQQLVDASDIDMQTLNKRIRQLTETNPMLGHRGCRLGVSYPEIYRMQVRAIFYAQLESQQQTSEMVIPQIMIPLIATNHEMQAMAKLVHQEAKKVQAEKGQEFPYLVGTMIELPRAALRAGDIAQHAAFFSVGSNDLTQTTFGLSRDDSSSFLQTYIAEGLLPYDPFVSLDQNGVGELIEIAIQRGRKTNPEIKIGICGEHGGDPASIHYCGRIGMDYVSCSPYRVPIARLAAAQAGIYSSKIW